MMDNPHIHPAVKKRMERERARAVKAAEDAVASARTTYGETHPAVAAALCELAKLQQSQSAFDQAEATLVRALAIREQHPSDTAAWVETLRTLGRLYDVTGQSNKSRPLMQRAATMEVEAFHADLRPVESAEPEYNAHAEFVEEMAGSAPKTFWTEALLGVLVPALLWWRGMSIAITGRAVCRGPSVSMAIDPLIITGPAAVLIGLVWLCAGALAHFNFFWPYRNRTLCAYGKTVSLITGVILLFAALTVMWTG